MTVVLQPDRTGDVFRLWLPSFPAMRSLAGDGLILLDHYPIEVDGNLGKGDKRSSKIEFRGMVFDI